MDRSDTYSIAEMPKAVQEDGLIDRYETRNAYITFYQGGSVYSLHEDHARSFLSRVMRAVGIGELAGTVTR